MIMMDHLRLYGRYVGVSIRGQMQYRASFVMMSLGNFLGTAIEFVGLWVLFDRFGQLEHWSLAEVAFFYGLINVAFALAEATGRGFDTFPNMVRSGDFDRLLLRPRSTAFQIAAAHLQLMRIGRLAQGLIVLLWAGRVLDVVWTWPRIGLTVGAILGGAALFYGLFVLQATLSFWTIESLEIMNTVTYGGCETAQFPLTIYRPWFRRFFTFVVPLACVSYFPALAILDRTDPAMAVAEWIQYTAPAVGVLFLAVSLQVWRFGVRHYASTGS